MYVPSEVVQLDHRAFGHCDRLPFFVFRAQQSRAGQCPLWLSKGQDERHQHLGGPVFLVDEAWILVLDLIHTVSSSFRFESFGISGS